MLKIKEHILIDLCVKVLSKDPGNAKLCQLVNQAQNASSTTDTLLTVMAALEKCAGNGVLPNVNLIKKVRACLTVTKVAQAVAPSESEARSLVAMGPRYSHD